MHTDQLTAWSGNPGGRTFDTFTYDLTCRDGLAAQTERDEVIDEVLLDDVYRLATFTSEGDVWVDAGCHLGVFSIAAMMHGADVSAMIDMDEGLSQIAQLNARQFLTQLARRMPEDVELHRHRIWPSGMAFEIVDAAALIECSMLTREAWAGRRPCLKLDIQGGEVAVLEQAEELASAFARIVFEWHQPEDLAVALGRLEAAGWRVDAVKFHEDVLLRTNTHIVWATSVDF